MKIESIQLLKFKRFADLTIKDLPPVKLVVLTGPNGSGKSSLFDGLLQWKYQSAGTIGFNSADPYYSRDPAAGVPFGVAAISWHGTPPSGQEQIKKAIDCRSSYRNEPSFELKDLKKQQPIVSEQRFSRLIEQDTAVSKNYQRLVSSILRHNVDQTSRNKSIGALQDELLSSLRTSLKNLFPGELELADIGDPLVSGSFYFSKGAVPRYPYMNLSGGEKAAFDLVLDLGVKIPEFDDTVFCIDEPEAHMSTRLQGALLVELLRLIPKQSQLWIATHSIGMMRKAKELYDKDPTSVAFLDFTGKDFDHAVVMRPVVPTRAFWRSVLSVALDDLAELVVPSTIVVCEGNPASAVPGKNQEHDARCYRAIFDAETAEVEFLCAGNATDVQTDRLAIVRSVQRIAAGVKIIPVIDRDDHSPADVVKLNSLGYKVLSRRNIQSYLYDDEVLDALCDQEGASIKKPAVKKIKTDALARSIAKKNPPDDLKRAAGEIVVGLKKELSLVGRGNDTAAIERNVLAPLIRPGMKAYQDLKTDIFG